MKYKNNHNSLKEEKEEKSIKRPKRKRLITISTSQKRYKKRLL